MNTIGSIPLQLELDRRFTVMHRSASRCSDPWKQDRLSPYTSPQKNPRFPLMKILHPGFTAGPMTAPTCEITPVSPTGSAAGV